MNFKKALNSLKSINKDLNFKNISKLEALDKFEENINNLDTHYGINETEFIIKEVKVLKDLIKANKELVKSNIELL